MPTFMFAVDLTFLVKAPQEKQKGSNSGRLKFMAGLSCFTHFCILHCLLCDSEDGERETTFLYNSPPPLQKWLFSKNISSIFTKMKSIKHSIPKSCLMQALLNIQQLPKSTLCLVNWPFGLYTRLQFSSYLFSIKGKRSNFSVDGKAVCLTVTKLPLEPFCFTHSPAESRITHDVATSCFKILGNTVLGRGYVICVGGSGE